MLDNVIQCNDPIVLEPSESLGFVQKTTAKARIVKQMRLYELQRDGPLCAGVKRHPHVAHPPTSE
jgi:hypothetical protein